MSEKVKKKSKKNTSNDSSTPVEPLISNTVITSPPDEQSALDGLDEITHNNPDDNRSLHSSALEDGVDMRFAEGPDLDEYIEDEEPVLSSDSEDNLDLDFTSNLRSLLAEQGGTGQFNDDQQFLSSLGVRQTLMDIRASSRKSQEEMRSMKRMFSEVSNKLREDVDNVKKTYVERKQFDELKNLVNQIANKLSISTPSMVLRNRGRHLRVCLLFLSHVMYGSCHFSS